MNSRKEYIQYCREVFKQFRSAFTYFIDGKKRECLLIRYLYRATNGVPQPYIGQFDYDPTREHQGLEVYFGATKKYLRVAYRKPRTKVGVVVVYRDKLGSVFVGGSKCNATSGDKFDRYIGLWSAIKIATPMMSEDQPLDCLPDSLHVLARKTFREAMSMKLFTNPITIETGVNS